ncbi:MAG: hypothetical protein ACR2RB_06405 [Gammaproteobacteria bacterium]
MTHRNGLVISRPEGFTDNQTETGFALVESGNIRSPRVIEVSLFDAAPKLERVRKRNLVDQPAAIFAVRELGAGSGGAASSN